MHVKYTRRVGFSLIELLVVLGVLTLLMALLIPAVQYARESARRGQCQSNLRQIGIALNAHHASAGRYPSHRLSGSSLVFLLPYLDQDVLYAQANLAPLARTESPYPLNWTVSHQKVATFLCPSAGKPPKGPEVGPSYPGNSYRFNSKPYCYNYELKVDEYGIDLIGGSSAAISDGLAKTIGLSEGRFGDGNNTIYSPNRDIGFAGLSDVLTYIGITPICQKIRDGCAAMQNRSPLGHSSRIGRFWFYADNADLIYNHLGTPNQEVSDCVMGSNGESVGHHGVYAARSEHPGGVNVLLMDGSVHFVSNSIDYAVWQALGTRANGDDVSGF